MPLFSVKSFLSLSIRAASPNPLSITFAPSAARRVAIPRPMPDVEPVTRAVFPLSMGFLSWVQGGCVRSFGLDGNTSGDGKTTERAAGGRLLRHVLPVR